MDSPSSSSSSSAAPLAAHQLARPKRRSFYGMDLSALRDDLAAGKAAIDKEVSEQQVQQQSPHQVIRERRNSTAIVTRNEHLSSKDGRPMTVHVDAMDLIVATDSAAAASGEHSASPPEKATDDDKRKKRRKKSEQKIQRRSSRKGQRRSLLLKAQSTAVVTEQEQMKVEQVSAAQSMLMVSRERKRTSRLKEIVAARSGGGASPPPLDGSGDGNDVPPGSSSSSAPGEKKKKKRKKHHHSSSSSNSGGGGGGGNADGGDSSSKKKSSEKHQHKRKHKRKGEKKDRYQLTDKEREQLLQDIAAMSEDDKIREKMFLHARMRKCILAAQFLSFLRAVALRQKQKRQLAEYQQSVVRQSAATCIQAAWRCYMVRKHHKVSTTHMQARLASQRNAAANSSTEAHVEFDVPDSPQNLVINDKGEVECATIEKLIECLCQRPDDHGLMDVVLLTFPTFLSAEQFLCLLRARWTTAQGTDHEGLVVSKTVQILHTWIKTFGGDFRGSESLTNAFHNMLDQVMTPEQSRTLRHIFDKSLRQTDRSGADFYTDLMKHITSFPRTKEPKNFSIASDLLSVRSKELARQLALIDHSQFVEILPREMLNQAWTKAGKEKHAPNVLAFIARFNQVAAWTVCAILANSSLDERGKCIVKFISIAAECLELRNYSSLMAIVSGLQNAAIDRLKHSWNLVPISKLKIFRRLQEIMGLENNHARYRSELNKCEKPCVPFIGTFLHDLVYLDEVPNRVGEFKLLNVEKRYQLFNVIKNLAGNQDGYYHLRPIPLMQQMLLTVRTMDDKQSYARSLEVEPRGFNPSSSPFIGRRRGTIFT